MEMITLLQEAVAKQASDLHISAGLRPILRIDGLLQTTTLPVQSAANIELMLQGIMATENPDFSFEQPGLGRFRAHVFHQARGLALAIRIIPKVIPNLDSLGLPAVVKTLTQLEQGLILVTGPTGCGKSTTLAAMIDTINQTKQQHILTLEDPIEFLHENKQCLIHQRELQGNFREALRSALREDPDVILVGELRDLDSIGLALTAAETGHLVLGSLHTNSASQTIHRLIDAFPAAEQNRIRSMLSESLQAVLSQRLFKKVGGGRLAAMEVLRCTPAIRHLIRENKIAQIYSCMQTGQAQGMQTLEQHLAQLHCIETNPL